MKKLFKPERFFSAVWVFPFAAYAALVEFLYTGEVTSGLPFLIIGLWVGSALMLLYYYNRFVTYAARKGYSKKAIKDATKEIWDYSKSVPDFFINCEISYQYNKKQDKHRNG